MEDTEKVSWLRGGAIPHGVEQALDDIEALLSEHPTQLPQCVHLHVPKVIREQCKVMLTRMYTHPLT